MNIHHLPMLAGSNHHNDDLAFAFSTLKRMNEAKRSDFCFLKQSADYALLLHIGDEQARGHRINMNNILTSGLGTPSTLIRRMSALEDAEVVRKTRSGADRRNTYYELTDLPLQRVQHFLGSVEALFAQPR